MLAIQVTVAAITLFATLYTATLLGDHAYGFVGIFLSIVQVVMTLQALGLNPSLISQVSEGGPSSTPTILVSFLFFRLLTLFVATLLLIALGPTVATAFTMVTEGPEQLIDLTHLFLLLACAMVSIELNALINTSLIAIQQSRAAALLSAASQLFIAFGMLVGAQNGGLDGFFEGYAVGASAALVVSVCVVTLLVRPKLSFPTKAQLYEHARRAKEMSGTSYLTKLIYSLWIRLPVFVGAWVLGPESLGALFLATQLAEKFRTLGSSIAPLSQASLSKTLAESPAAYERQFSQNFRKLFLTLIMVTMGAILTAPIFFGLIFPGTYPGLGSYLSLMLLFSVFFLTLNWIGAGVLYPHQALESLVVVHLVTKTVGAAAMILAALVFSSATAFLMIFVVSEMGAAMVYRTKARKVLADSETLPTAIMTSGYFLCFASAALTAHLYGT